MVVRQYSDGRQVWGDRDRQCRRDVAEVGSGTVWVLSALALVTVVALVVLTVVRLHTEHTRIQAVADMAALASADAAANAAITDVTLTNASIANAASRSRDPCAVARRVVALNAHTIGATPSEEMTVFACTVRGFDTWIVVTRHLTLVGGGERGLGQISFGHVTVEAKAHAGVDAAVIPAGISHERPTGTTQEEPAGAAE